MFQHVNQSIKIKFNSFVYALGISHVGYVTTNLISKGFSSIEDLLIDIILGNTKNIGYIVLNNIKIFLKNAVQIKLIRKLLNIVIIINGTSLRSNILFQKKILFTGVFDSITRYEAEKIVLDLGGGVVSNITKKSDILVVGKKPGLKLYKAQQLNIKIIYESDFISLVNAFI